MWEWLLASSLVRRRHRGGRPGTRRSKASRAVLKSRLRGQPKERDIQAQGLAQTEDAVRLEMPSTQERQTYCFSGKQTCCPLTQPSAMPGTSALMALCRLCPLGAKSPLSWAGDPVRRCLWKFLMTNFLLLPNLATGAGVSLTLAGSQHEHL